MYRFTFQLYERSGISASVGFHKTVQVSVLAKTLKSAQTKAERLYLGTNFKIISVEEV